MRKENYALVIGGTGMLAEVSRKLVNDYHYVSVVGRRTIKISIKKSWKLFHVQGSSRFFKKENTSVPETYQYRRIYLGFIVDGST